MTEKTVGILGCGPSGLVAANAVEAAGLRPIIVSKIRKSYIAGAQYSHDPIIGIHGDEPDTIIDVSLHGTQAGYAEKVYGNPEAPVSWSRYMARGYGAWNLRSAYEALWQRYEPQLIPWELTPANAAQAATEGVLDGVGPRRVGGIRADAWISTVPLQALCAKQGFVGSGHGFVQQAVHIVQTEDVDKPSGCFIEYNGEENPAWYRRSYIFGTEAFEWSAETMAKKPPVEGVVTIQKPLATNCDCLARSNVPFMLAGRYGRWEKSQLINHVQRDTVKFMDYLKGKV